MQLVHGGNMKNKLAVAFSLLTIGALLSGCSIGASNVDAEPQDTTQQSSEQSETAQAEAETVPEESSNETLGQSNAVAKAESYLDFSAFSRKGLIEQLEFEGFDTADAQYAVDKVDPDWNEQAALKAKSYLEFSSFSRTGLIDQLKFEGFSDAEAEFGATAVGY